MSSNTNQARHSSDKPDRFPTVTEAQSAGRNPASALLTDTVSLSTSTLQQSYDSHSEARELVPLEVEDGHPSTEQDNIPLLGISQGSRLWWPLEAASLVLSISCLVAVVVLASRIDNTRLDNWGFRIQPSTVVSILTTASQSSMMFAISEVISQSKWLYFWGGRRALSEFAIFESASRGPMGSLQLIFQSSRGRFNLRPLVAYAASLITVAALAMGPFAQQIVATRQETVKDNMNSSLITVTNYFNTKRVCDDDNTISNTLAVSFYSGLLGTDSGSFDIICKTGHCSWSEFASLELCSTCEDVSSVTEVIDQGSTLVPPGGLNLNMSLDGGYSLFAINSTADSVDAKPPDPTLVKFVVAWNITSWPLTESPGNWNVTSCSINWCIRQYTNVSVKDGILQPYETQNLPLQYQETTPHIFSGCETRGGGYYDYHFIPAEGNFHGGSQPIFPFEDSRFSVLDVDHRVLGNYFQHMFVYAHASNDEVADAFLTAPSISAVMANVTESVSSIIRSGGTGWTIGKGETYSQKTMIDIDWQWLSLPILLVLASSAALVSIMMQMRHHIHQNATAPPPLWKSSAFPPIFCDIDLQDLDTRAGQQLPLGNLETPHDMEIRAESIQGQLQRAGDESGFKIFGPWKLSLNVDTTRGGRQ